MSHSHTDLVIEIPTSEIQPDSNFGVQDTEGGEMHMALRQWLQPGVEIMLAFNGCTAITSILWTTDPQSRRSFRAGVRLLGFSALPIAECLAASAPRSDCSSK
jgi:hypothetical protein